MLDLTPSLLIAESTFAHLTSQNLIADLYLGRRGSRSGQAFSGPLSETIAR